PGTVECQNLHCLPLRILALRILALRVLAHHVLAPRQSARGPIRRTRLTPPCPPGDRRLRATLAAHGRANRGPSMLHKARHTAMTEEVHHGAGRDCTRESFANTRYSLRDREEFHRRSDLSAGRLLSQSRC